MYVNKENVSLNARMPHEDEQYMKTLTTQQRVPVTLFAMSPSEREYLHLLNQLTDGSTYECCWNRSRKIVAVKYAIE